MSLCCIWLHSFESVTSATSATSAVVDLDSYQLCAPQMDGSASRILARTLSLPYPRICFVCLNCSRLTTMHELCLQSFPHGNTPDSHRSSREHKISRRTFGEKSRRLGRGGK